VREAQSNMIRYALPAMRPISGGSEVDPAT
jgi:hypothetical protein